MKFSDGSIQNDCTPVPRGLACIFRSGRSSALSPYVARLFQKNVQETILSYRGSLADWAEYLALEPKYLPTSFQGAKVALTSSGSLQLQFQGIRGEVRVPHLDSETRLTLAMGYPVGQRLGLEVLRYMIQPRINKDETYSVTSLYSPLLTDADDRKKTWAEVVTTRAPFDGKAFVSGDVNQSYRVINGVRGRSIAVAAPEPVHMASPVPGASPTPLASPMPPSPLANAADKYYLAVCAMETSNQEYKIEEACRAFASGIQVLR
jgi:hypothetical protein